MSESVVTEPPAASDPVEPGTEPEPKEIDWKAEARKHEARAKENAAKAKANEGAAQRLAEIEEANKTADQKANDRLAAAEQRAAELEARANRATVANEHGIPEAILAGPASSSAEDLAAYAEALIAFRGEQKQAPKSDALSRVNQSSVAGGDVAFARSLFADN
jgi:hypothetical protein